MQNSKDSCTLCPRECGSRQNGICQSYSSGIRIARYSLHEWEEPPISFQHGSGTIFFSGCNLRCVYCQNMAVSHENLGTEYSADKIADIIIELERMGAENINLVTPTHYTHKLIPILKKVRPSLNIPIIWNSSAYEKVDTLRKLKGLIDIYLPDYKYADSELSLKYSAAANYPDIAKEAIAEMYSQVGDNVISSNGKMLHGMIIRHLVLPGCKSNSISAINAIAEIVPPASSILSIMSQYTPSFAKHCSYKNLQRKITTFEYDRVCEHAERLGFNIFYQDISSSSANYTPDFFGTKLK